MRICQKRLKAEFSIVQHVKARHPSNSFRDVDMRPPVPVSEASTGLSNKALLRHVRVAAVEDNAHAVLSSTVTETDAPRVESNVIPESDLFPNPPPKQRHVYKGSSRLRHVFYAAKCDTCSNVGPQNYLKTPNLRCTNQSIPCLCFRFTSSARLRRKFCMSTLSSGMVWLRRRMQK